MIYHSDESSLPQKMFVIPTMYHILNWQQWQLTQLS